MTDRLKGLTVTLRANMRHDEAQPIINAIKLLSGVIDVQFYVENPEHHIAVMQARIEMREKLLDVILGN